MRDFTEQLDELQARRREAAVYLRVDELRARQPQLETEASRPDLWDDPDRARKVTTELAAVNDDLGRYDALGSRLDDAATLAELAREENDESVEPEIADALALIDRELSDLELRSLFGGEHDELDAVTAGQEAGISSATFIVKGRYAYGYLQAERGVHRLVRISPFNAQGKRQTAFCALQVSPMLEDADTEVEIDDKELRIDVYRSSGAGGQHVNVTDSAVRITHLPTGIVVSCQNERSQHQNKDRAMQILRAKLAELERERREEELAAIKGEQQRVGFGSQIRSYVLQPYQLVKDLRTDHETGNVDGVLDGDLDPFMEAWLRWRRANVTAG
jgi:peptide chain release factor 2